MIVIVNRNTVYNIQLSSLFITDINSHHFTLTNCYYSLIINKWWNEQNYFNRLLWYISKFRFSSVNNDSDRRQRTHFIEVSDTFLSFEQKNKIWVSAKAIWNVICEGDDQNYIIEKGLEEVLFLNPCGRCPGPESN